MCGIEIIAKICPIFNGSLAGETSQNNWIVWGKSLFFNTIASWLGPSQKKMSNPRPPLVDRQAL